ncbi:putative uncharacterized protein DDB_G0287457 isoform X2 [Cydia pomonella]|uniref:putative uncharacterized protein DDB_G0287457 isoform X2 n=1 Tax=Cydia pomonella TaxID=82600 RepID=UPI002ADD76F2|nr:putative uncharacterized protein DDB_G0287457 isoform X2 [Cydia pomonella]
MTTYSISLDDVDLALLPLRTHSYNNFLKKEIYQFQVMKTASCEAPEPPIFYTCHICAIEVPTAFAGEHAASQKHKANVRIACVAAERMRAFISALPPTYATRPCARFCVNCSKEADEDHEKTNEHRVSVMLDSLLWDLMKAYVQDHDESKSNREFQSKETNGNNQSKINNHKQDEVIINQVEGNDKNNNDIVDEPINNNQPTKPIEDIVEVDEQEGKLVENNCEVNDNSEKSSEDNVTVNIADNIDINNKIEEKTNKEHILRHEKDDYGDELRKFIDDKNSFEYKELVKISIKLNDNIINNIDSDNYHSYDRTCDDGSLHCILCDYVLNDKDAEIHKYDSEHVRRVSNLGNDGHYIREINEFYSHCILCNLKIQNMDLELHRQSATHNVKEYLYTNTRSEIIKEHKEAEMCNVKQETLSENGKLEHCEEFNENDSLEEYFIVNVNYDWEEESANEETNDNLEKYFENNELKNLFEEHSESQELDDNLEGHSENEESNNLEEYCEKCNACLKELVDKFEEYNENEGHEKNTKEFSENKEYYSNNEEPIHHLEQYCGNKPHDNLHSYKEPEKHEDNEEFGDNLDECNIKEEVDYNSQECSENEESNDELVARNEEFENNSNDEYNEYEDSEDNWEDYSENKELNDKVVKLTDDITTNIMVKIDQLTTNRKEDKIERKREEIKKNIVKYDSQKYAEELRKYIDVKDSFEFKETYIKAQIRIKDSILKTYSDRFHGYNRLCDQGTIKCMVCDCIFNEEHGEDHKFDSNHMRKIANLGEDGHYIREINETHSHCILCNLKIENINMATHKELFSHKFCQRLFTRNATTKVNEEVIAKDGTEIHHSPPVINQSIKNCESNCHSENHDADQELKVENVEINEINKTSTEEPNIIQATKDQNVLVTNNDVETVDAKVVIGSSTNSIELTKAVNTVKTNHHCDSKDYGDELRKFIDSKCFFEFDERSNVIRVMMDDEMISIYSDHFHSFDRTYYGGRLKCIVCDCILKFEEAEEHKYDPKHIRRVLNLGNDQHYLRKIDESYSHCILCNLKIKNENLDKHKRVLLHTIKKDLYTSKTKNTNKEVTTEKNVNEIKNGDGVSNEKNVTTAVGPIKTIDTIVGTKIEHPYEITATGTLRCMVCDCQVPNGVQNREEHVRGLRHRNLI